MCLFPNFSFLKKSLYLFFISSFLKLFSFVITLQHHIIKIIIAFRKEKIIIVHEILKTSYMPRYIHQSIGNSEVQKDVTTTACYGENKKSV